ncbi:MAG: hypothetical protein ACTSUE_16010 [Promethearchaeota archaeon]
MGVICDVRWFVFVCGWGVELLVAGFLEKCVNTINPETSTTTPPTVLPTMVMVSTDAMVGGSESLSTSLAWDSLFSGGGSGGGGGGDDDGLLELVGDVGVSFVGSSDPLGETLGEALGVVEGDKDGESEGPNVGELLLVGCEVGTLLGDDVGVVVGVWEGPKVGATEGLMEGYTLGDAVGAFGSTGLVEGDTLGLEDGLGVGQSISLTIAFQPSIVLDPRVSNTMVNPPLVEV